MGNSHTTKFNMGHIGNIGVYIERTFKYLHFACGTFLKNVKKVVKNVPMFEKLLFQTWGDFLAFL